MTETTKDRDNAWMMALFRAATKHGDVSVATGKRIIKEVMGDAAPPFRPPPPTSAPPEEAGSEEHEDTGRRCLVHHGPHDAHEGACIRCSCGEWVRPDKWAEHSATPAGSGEGEDGLEALDRVVARVPVKDREGTP